MKLNRAWHLAYCTNIHRGETWAETFDSLKQHTLAVRERVCPRDAFAIGLRLSHQAAAGLSDPKTLRQFQTWLDQNGCYVFTINGFPFGRFHGECVKEQVYAPDWSSTERVAYTNLLFDLLAGLLPPGIEGSVSTLPCSFKGFQPSAAAQQIMRQNLWQTVTHIANVSAQTGRQLHLGLEPEPLCLLENTAEIVDFFEQLRTEHDNDPRLDAHLGVNYDTCHFAVEYEEPETALNALHTAGIKISKIHLSSALKASATPEAREALRAFSDDVYLHQVIARDETGALKCFRDLPGALQSCETQDPSVQSGPPESENFKLKTPADWRIHFHVPLHASPAPPLENTNDHLLGALDWLAAHPQSCAHLEMETYTWEVLPTELKSRDVVEQLVSEYQWTMDKIQKAESQSTVSENQKQVAFLESKAIVVSK